MPGPIKYQETCSGSTLTGGAVNVPVATYADLTPCAEAGVTLMDSSCLFFEGAPVNVNAAMAMQNAVARIMCPSRSAEAHAWKNDAPKSDSSTPEFACRRPYQSPSLE